MALFIIPVQVPTRVSYSASCHTLFSNCVDTCGFRHAMEPSREDSERVPVTVLAPLFSYAPFLYRFLLAGVYYAGGDVVFSTNALCWRHVEMWRPMRVMQLNRAVRLSERAGDSENRLFLPICSVFGACLCHAQPEECGPEYGEAHWSFKGPHTCSGRLGRTSARSPHTVRPLAGI